MNNSIKLFRVLIALIIIIIVGTVTARLTAKSKVNYEREIQIIEQRDEIGDEALRAYGRQMATRCSDNYNEWVRQLAKDGYMIKTEGFKK